MKPKYKRLLLLLCAMIIASAGAVWLLKIFNENIIFFYKPSEITSQIRAQKKLVRVGGLVVAGSIKKIDTDYLTFTISDKQHTLIIEHRGEVPALFKDSQGVVAQGHFQNGKFYSTKLLAKHDENYMPKELMDVIKTDGTWRGK